MWKARESEMLNDTAREMLPFLTTYSDMFWEGRDETNDDHIIEAFSLHIATHVVKSRYTEMTYQDRSIL